MAPRAWILAVALSAIFTGNASAVDRKRGSPFRQMFPVVKEHPDYTSGKNNETGKAFTIMILITGH